MNDLTEYNVTQKDIIDRLTFNGVVDRSRVERLIDKLFTLAEETKSANGAAAIVKALLEIEKRQDPMPETHDTDYPGTSDLASIAEEFGVKITIEGDRGETRDGPSTDDNSTIIEGTVIRDKPGRKGRPGRAGRRSRRQAPGAG